MKRCPQCKAEYDQHVEYCFVDGAELVDLGDDEGGPLPPPPSSSRLLPIVFVLAGLSMLVMLVVLVLVVMTWSDAPPDDELMAAPTPAVAPPPEPIEDGPGATVHKIMVRSTPSGAEVWEGSTLLCPATPCSVEHPDHAPIPRVFELRRDGYTSTRIEMTDVNAPLEARLRDESAPRRSPSPRAEPAPAEPAPTKATGAGTIMDER